MELEAVLNYWPAEEQETSFSELTVEYNLQAHLEAVKNAYLDVQYEVTAPTVIGIDRQSNLSQEDTPPRTESSSGLKATVAFVSIHGIIDS